MTKARRIGAMAAALAIVAALGAGLWFGGGPTTRAGWEAAAWTAGITSALALAANAIIWATTRTPTSPPQATELPSHTPLSTTTGNISGGTVIQAGSTDDLHTGNTSYSGDHVDLSHGTFHGPVTGKEENHHHYPAHQVDWPIRIGAIPEQAAHYQHRATADQLDTALNGFGTVVLRQVLSGTGGVGKTQIAAHHARALREATDPDERVDLLVWANASTRDQITFAYTQAAQQLFATVPEDPEHAAGLFLTWLQDPNKHADRKWLVVWDDLADPAAVQDLWPPHDQPSGRVLVTTRRRDHTLTQQGRHLIDVGVYTPKEAHTFLADALNETGIAHIPADLESLAHDLGHLPLALGQAVIYMAELDLGCRDYLQVFHDRMRTLGEVFPDWEAPTPLAATWELSLAQADAFHPQGLARPMMGLIALLDGSGIPEQVLTTPPVLEYLAAHDTRTVATAATLSLHQVRAALTNLVRLNLITRTTTPTKTPETTRALVGAHQLVQRAAREHITTRPTLRGVHSLGNALIEVWPKIETDTVLAQLLRSNTFVLRACHGVDSNSEKWLWQPDCHPVLFLAGTSLGEAGRVGDSVAYWTEMEHTARIHLGPNHSSTFSTRGNLAHWRGEAGDAAGAAQAYEDLLTDQLHVLGPDHPDILISRSNLASWRGEVGDATGAVQAYEQLLADQSRVLDPGHLHFLMARNNLAHWRGEAGDAAGAAQAYEDLLTDRLRVLGPDHPHTLTTRNNLAHWRGEAGDRKGATIAYKQLLADQTRILGPDHPDTLLTRNNLGYCYGEAGDATGAARIYEDLLTDQLRVLSPDHPNTLATRANLAWCAYKSGDTTKSIELLTALIPDQKRVLGLNLPHTQAREEVRQHRQYKQSEE